METPIYDTNVFVLAKYITDLVIKAETLLKQ